MSVSEGRRPFLKPVLSGLALSGLVLCAAGPARAQHSATVDLPDSIAAAGTAVVWVKKVPFFCEGPAVDPIDGTVYFSEQHGNDDMSWPIWRISNPGNPNDTGSRWIVNSNQTNGIFVDGKGRVIAAQNGKIVRYLKNGTVDSVLATSGNTATFGQANDFNIGKNGEIFFSDLKSQIFYRNTAGKVTAVASGLSGPNGVEWIEEENLLYVNAGGHPIRFDVGANGVLTNKRDFYTGMGGADGMTSDSHGNWYVGSYSDGSVHVCNAAGKLIGKITFKMTAGQYDARGGTQGNIVNCQFGGAENKTLYCTGDGGLYSINLKIPGRKSPAVATNLLISPKARAGSGSVQAFRADGRFWFEKGLEGKAGARLPLRPLTDAGR